MKGRSIRRLLLTLPFLFVSLSACDSAVEIATVIPVLTQLSAPPGTPQPLGERTKISGCVSQKSLPDPACTPGAVFEQATVAEICTPGYSSSVRDVPASLKDEVYAEYGIFSHEPGQYEVDHLVPLELGGSNDIANLWPEPAEPRPGFHEKDRVENHLHDQVCAGHMSLQDAQSQIATDWVATYQALP